MGDPNTPEEIPKRLRLPGVFRIVLAGESLSLFGTQIASMMIPIIAVLTLHSGEFMIGVLSAAGWLPIIIFGLLAGTIVDRTSRWVIMVICNVVRGILITIIPILAFINQLTIPALIIIAFFVGICNVFFDIAYQTYVPDLVSTDLLGLANSRLELIRSIAQLAGPLLGGVLATAYKPEYLISINSVTFLIALVALLFLPGRYRILPQPPTEKDSPNPKIFEDVLSGLRLVWQSRQIRLVVTSGAFLNIFVAGASALFVLFVTRTLGYNPTILGISVALLGVGAFCGAATYPYWSKKFHEGQCVALGLTSMALGTILLALSAWTSIPLATLLAAQVLIGYGTPIINIALVTLRQKLTPPGALGKVNASARVAIMSSLPLGALIISFIGEKLGIPAALWVAAIGEVAVLCTLGSALLRMRPKTL
ncbi:MFS transporter [Lysinibacter sp. HNR]|nr:MFS transporter [Lysinibacter sp. HNR]WGD38567.1 MFS transporter [Lysinibacter sp. HNR]